jgi:hypothetical protein
MTMDNARNHESMNHESQMAESREEFYIGYDPPMPPRLARFITRIAIGAAAGAVSIAAIAAIGHVPLDGGTFAFGQPRAVSGMIADRPYPALRIDGIDPAAPWPLLVAPGKHGADALVRGLGGQRVTLKGTPIQRDGYTMFEVTPGSVAPVPPSAEGRLETESASIRQTTGTHADADTDTASSGQVTLRGEIVDSKCFLGVMVPGAGQTHKDCASLCLRGGIPPALFVRDRMGRSSLLLLEDLSGHPVGPRAIALAGEPVEISGTTSRQQGWLRLRSDPATWRPLAASPAADATR